METLTKSRIQIKTKTTKKKIKTTTSKTYFIVIWDNDDGDPVALFNTKQAAENFIKKSLLTDEIDDPRVERQEYVKKESIKLYEGTLIGKAKVEVSFVK